MGSTNQEAPHFSRRIAAFALDYILIIGYLIILASLSSFLALGPLKGRWKELISSPVHMDLIAFFSAVLPVILYFTLQESSSKRATWGKHRMNLQVLHRDGGRLSLGRSLVRSILKFLPWQLTHTCLFYIPGWPMDPEKPPFWVFAGLILVWVIVIFYIITMAFGSTRRTPYDWIAGSKVVYIKKNTN